MKTGLLYLGVLLNSAIDGIVFANAASWQETGHYFYSLLDVGINDNSAGYVAALADGIGSIWLKSSTLGQNWTLVEERDGFFVSAKNANNIQHTVPLFFPTAFPEPNHKKTTKKKDLACTSLNPKDAAMTGLMGKGLYTLDGGATIHDTVGFVAGSQSLSRNRYASQSGAYLYGSPAGEGMSAFVLSFFR
ncbi:hypothetical protein RFI_15353 [Reticulomyxa filosa]|uniref:Uncharacterized protein n=1 Tax=Reticulomyxa filosa TaxID=46433 RepID=X6N7G5_RETFI|nr:hypothetical protein RFI_15353 [Reticulomyxa filosa]|eukprot:ETO21848.1 hypothetical protein RFI_15353 [Reticulomyxa filosa]